MAISYISIVVSSLYSQDWRSYGRLVGMFWRDIAPVICLGASLS